MPCPDTRGQKVWPKARAFRSERPPAQDSQLGAGRWRCNMHHTTHLVQLHQGSQQRQGGAGAKGCHERWYLAAPVRPLRLVTEGSRPRCQPLRQVEAHRLREGDRGEVPQLPLPELHGRDVWSVRRGGVEAGHAVLWARPPTCERRCVHVAATGPEEGLRARCGLRDPAGLRQHAAPGGFEAQVAAIVESSRPRPL